MDFQDKLVHVLFCLVSVLEVSCSQFRDLLMENMSIPKALQILELNPVSNFQTGPFESTDDRSYNHAYDAKSGLDSNREKIIQPEQIRTGNPKISKWVGNEELAKQNGDQLKWLINLKLISNIAEQVNKLNCQIKNLQKMSKILTDLKAEVSQIKKSISVDSFAQSYKKMNSDDKIENKIKIPDKNTINQVNNVSHNNQYQVENTYIINIISEEKNSSLTDVEILKELTDHKIEELLEKAVNNLTEEEIPSVTQSPLQEYETYSLKQLQRNFSNVFNNQNVTLEHVEQMSKIIDFVERYHGLFADLDDTAEWYKPKSGGNENSEYKRYKNKNKKKAVKNKNGKGRIPKRRRRSE